MPPQCWRAAIRKAAAISLSRWIAPSEVSKTTMAGVLPFLNWAAMISVVSCSAYSKVFVNTLFAEDHAEQSGEIKSMSSSGVSIGGGVVASL